MAASTHDVTFHKLAGLFRSAPRWVWVVLVGKAVLGVLSIGVLFLISGR